MVSLQVWNVFQREVCLAPSLTPFTKQFRLFLEFICCFIDAIGFLIDTIISYCMDITLRDSKCLKVQYKNLTDCILHMNHH